MQRTALNSARAIASSSRLPACAAPLLRPPPPRLVAHYTRADSRRVEIPPPPHPSFPPLIFSLVQVVDTETGKLSDPERLSTVLQSIDTSTHYPLVVSKDPPIVRIKNIAEHVASVTKTEAKKKAERKIQADKKQIQVPWTSADGDVGTKLALGKEALLAGSRLEVVFAPKASGGNKKAPVAKERSAELISRFEAELGEVGQKWRVDEEMPMARVLYFAPSPQIKAEAQKRAVENANARKQQSLDKKEAKRLRSEERRLKDMQRQAGSSK